MTSSGGAEQVVTSPGPEAVSVTVYRDPGRGNGRIDLDSLNGFALVTETRTLRLPRGASTIRFEGVAGGIVPVSSIVTGLPGGVVEKNREARLLSPAALVDGTLGRRVHLRRTDPTTGRVSESDAVVLAGPEGGVVLRTREGVVALGCSGLPERTLFPERPQGLSARPTLTVTTRSAEDTVATVTLSYLAQFFDWQANYVAHVAPNGRTLDLFAWLTLANGNDEGFANARTQAIAGTLNRDPPPPDTPDASHGLELHCWPQGTTSDVRSGELFPPPPAPPPPPQYAAAGEIVVTGSLIEARQFSAPMAVMTAEQEELGDLKLYRIPEPVTIAANAQKQVALLTRSHIPFDRLYGTSLDARGGDDGDQHLAEVMLRVKNSDRGGLGLPLPSGTVAVFEVSDGKAMLVGEPDIQDRAVGEEVELSLGESPQVRVVQRALTPETDEGDNPRLHEVEISNANPERITVEVLLLRYDDRLQIVKSSRKLGLKDGRTLWRARVPANGRAVLRYTTSYAPPSG
jgi:hypothetical protein